MARKPALDRPLEVVHSVYIRRRRTFDSQFFEQFGAVGKQGAQSLVAAKPEHLGPQTAGKPDRVAGNAIIIDRS